MSTSDLSFVPLQQASLCLDCEMITRAHGRCMACGSTALLGIARTLSRQGELVLRHQTNTGVAQIVSRRVTSRGDFLHST